MRFKIIAMLSFLTYLALPLNSITLTSSGSAVTHLSNGIDLVFGRGFSFVHFVLVVIPMLLFLVSQFNLFGNNRFVASAILSGVGILALVVSVDALMRFDHSAGTHASNTTTINYFEIGAILSFVLYAIVGIISIKSQGFDKCRR